MKNDHHDECNTRLGLGIGLDDFVPKIREQKTCKNKKVTCLDLSFPLDFKDDHKIDGSSSKENGEEEEERRSMCSIENQEHENYSVIRKKLRLTKEQSCVLEDSFKRQTTLNMAEKHALAEKLNLKPRQIEVWFQNRRARTKLKQTETDCIFLKRNCENLREENRRLKKELEELRLLMIQRAATCHTCEKFAKKSVKESGHAIKVECNLSRCD